MLRWAVAQGTELGRLVDGIMRAGGLVADEHVIQLVEEKLSNPKIAANFLMDGFPRTLPQAQALDASLRRLGVGLDRVIVLDVPDEVALKRMTARRTDPETGKIYNLLFSPPPPELESRLVQRADDREDAVRKRLRKFHAETQPVIPYYEQQGLVRHIDATIKPDQVFQRIQEILMEDRPPSSRGSALGNPRQAASALFL
jgi:adenylate kinase